MAGRGNIRKLFKLIRQIEEKKENKDQAQEWQSTMQTATNFARGNNRGSRDSAYASYRRKPRRKRIKRKPDTSLKQDADQPKASHAVEYTVGSLAASKEVLDGKEDEPVAATEPQIEGITLGESQQLVASEGDQSLQADDSVQPSLTAKNGDDIPPESLHKLREEEKGRNGPITALRLDVKVEDTVAHSTEQSTVPFANQSSETTVAESKLDSRHKGRSLAEIKKHFDNEADLGVTPSGGTSSPDTGSAVEPDEDHSSFEQLEDIQPPTTGHDRLHINNAVSESLIKDLAPMDLLTHPVPISTPFDIQEKIESKNEAIQMDAEMRRMTAEQELAALKAKSEKQDVIIQQLREKSALQDKKNEELEKKLEMLTMFVKGQYQATVV